MFLATAFFLVPGAPADPKAEKIRDLAKARLDAAEKTYQALRKRDLKYEYGEAFYTWSKRILEAQRELAREKKEIKAALSAHLERMREVEHWVQEAEPSLKMGNREKIPQATHYRVEAELWLEKGE
jgi:hypothetical protein